MSVPAVGALPPRVRERAPLPANATLGACQPLTNDIRLLRVRRDGGPIPFMPGQYITLGLWRDGAWLQRPYSPARTSADGEVELLVRRVHGGQMTPLLWTMPAGTRVRLGPARGLFRLAPDDRRTHLFLATGTGIAPLLAMAADLVALSDPPPIVMLHGVRHASDLAYRAQIAAWATDAPQLTYLPAVSRPEPGRLEPGLLPGRALDILPSIWPRLRIGPASVVAYLCGNPSVVNGAAEWLANRGLVENAIRREEYWPAT